MLPEKVLIGGIEYKISEKDLIIVNDRADMAGAHSLTKGEIEIWTGGSEQYKQLILSHEILHGILDAVKYDLTDREEQFVLSLERVFFQFLKDNTNFFDKGVV